MSLFNDLQDLDFSYNDNYVPNGDPFGDFNPNPVSKENNTSSLENDSTSLADKLGSTINLNNNSYDHSTPINSDSSPSSPASTSFTQHNSLGLHSSLLQFLKNDMDGRLILSSYESNRLLLPSMKNLLARKIILNELEQSGNTIPAFKLRFLASEIVKVFPSEEVDLWYFGCKRENGVKVSAGGKLYNSYTYLRAKFLKKVLCSSLSSNSSSMNEVDTNSSGSTKLEFLKKNNNPLDTVYEYWEATYGERRNFLSTCSGIAEYVNTFPILRLTEHAKELFQSDFNHFFHGKFPSNYFVECWRKEVGPKLKKLVISEISLPKYSEKRALLGILQNEQSDQGIIDGIIFSELPLLIRPVTVKRDKNGCTRPSMQEAHDAFILQIQNMSDLDQSISDRREVLNKKKQTFQPTPIFVGEKTNFFGYYVLLNHQLFKVNSAVEAVELAFHLFYALDAEYPLDSRLIWQFIQYSIYDIKLPSDKKSISLMNLLTKLRAISN